MATTAADALPMPIDMRSPPPPQLASAVHNTTPRSRSRSYDSSVKPNSPESAVSADTDNNNSNEDVDANHNNGTENENERYSFTPKRLPRGRPRAWERQPSQPFAPRREGQRIWRRAPLKNITASASAEVNAKWKRGVSDGIGGGFEEDGVVRPAKRVKIMETGLGMGKENEEVDAWGLALNEDVVREGYVVDAEHESFVGASTPRGEDQTAEADVAEPADEFAPEESMPSGIGQLDGVGSEQPGTTERPPLSPASSNNDEQQVPENDLDVSMANVSDPGSDEYNTQAVYAETTGRAETSKDASSAPVDSSDPADDRLPAEGMPATPPSNPTAQLEPDRLPEMCFDITPATNVGHDSTSSPIQQVSLEQDLLTGTAGQTDEVPDEILPGSEESLSPSEESSLSPAQHTVTEGYQDNEMSTTASATQPSRPYLQPEEDDTAFLQQFLQRAKQAREKNPALPLYRPVGEQVKRHLIDQQNQSLISSPQKNDRKRPRSPEPEDLSNLGNVEDGTITTTVLIPGVEDSTEKLPSPSRRSNRLNANTKLPRPQRPIALPSNISLRRLNGTEFISMAKQRTDAQTTAATTRNNTRKNKGSALSVQDKLKQMSLGFSDKGSNDDGPEPERKPKPRARKTTGVEYDRVSWSHKIARYQLDGEEHTLTLDGEWEPCAQPEDSNAAPEHDEFAAASATKAEPDSLDEAKTYSALKKMARSSSSSSSSSSSRGSSKSTKSRSKTRTDNSSTADPPTPASNTATKRKRAETIGTVNGTPAPKRGLDVLLESARENEGVATALGLSRRDGHAAVGEGTSGTGSGDVGEMRAETRGSKRLKAKQTRD